MMVMLNMNVYRIMLIRMEEKHKSKISVYIGHIFFFFYNPLQRYIFFLSRPKESDKKVAAPSLGVRHFFVDVMSVQERAT